MFAKLINCELLRCDNTAHSSNEITSGQAKAMSKMVDYQLACRQSGLNASTGLTSCGELRSKRASGVITTFGSQTIWQIIFFYSKLELSLRESFVVIAPLEFNQMSYSCC